MGELKTPTVSSSQIRSKANTKDTARAMRKPLFLSLLRMSSSNRLVPKSRTAATPKSMRSQTTSSLNSIASKGKASRMLEIKMKSLIRSLFILRQLLLS